MSWVTLDGPMLIPCWICDQNDLSWMWYCKNLVGRDLSRHWIELSTGRHGYPYILPQTSHRGPALLTLTMEIASSIPTVQHIFWWRPIVINNVQSCTSIDMELRLPKMASLVIIIICNLLLQVGSYCFIRHLKTLINTKISFFIIVSSSNTYVQHFGGYFSIFQCHPRYSDSICSFNHTWVAV